MFDVIVIGGGPAGTTAALRCRELGASVTLVEKGRMGGTCTNDGCAPTRVLAHAARLARDADQLESYGLAASRPKLDLGRLMARVRATIERLHDKKELIVNLTQAGVEVLDHTGAARFLDPATICLDGDRRLQARRFIICAGGHARRLDFPGCEHTLTHHDVWRLCDLPRSVVIVGAAATGCQLASIFNAFGSEVTLLEAAPRILGREDHTVSESVASGFESRGIRVISGIDGITRVEPTADGRRVHFTNDGAVQAIEATHVIVAVGWVGKLDELGLEAAGVEHDGRYILTGSDMRTSAAHIFAAGDVNGRAMLVQSAAHEARTAAENALLDSGRETLHQILPHGGFTDPEYGGVGLTEAEARDREPDCVAAVASYADLDRAVIDGRTEGFCKLIVSRHTHHLLGTHVVGEQALEVVEIAAACIAGSMPINRIAELEIAYIRSNSSNRFCGRRFNICVVIADPRRPRAETRFLFDFSHGHDHGYA